MEHNDTCAGLRAAIQWPGPGKIAGFALASILIFAAVAPGLAQVSPYGEKSMGDPAQDHLPDILNTVKITQRLGQQLPLDAPFIDSTGKAVKLGDYFGKHPVILSLVYYQCQVLCSEDLNGLVSALEMVKLTPGKDFDIVVVSIDPSEGTAVAAAKKATYVKQYGRPDTAAGWHFLTGSQPAINALAQAVGFGYIRLPSTAGQMTQFAHPTAIEVVTPEGRMAQYYMGVEYSPKDLLLGLVEASHHTIGTPVDNIMTYCYRYDPKLKRHSLVIARIVQMACVMTVLGLGSFMVVNFRRDIKQAAELQAGPTRTDKTKSE
jgi:protein SCO1